MNHHRVQINPLLRPASFTTRITEHRLFEPIVLSVICGNALWIGYEVNQADPDREEDPAFIPIVENTFCFIFTLEISLRFCAYIRPISFFRDAAKRVWNIFDATLVALLILELWIIPQISDSVEFPGLSSLRLLRLLRIARVLRMVPELAMMVKSMIAALRSVSMTFVLAVGIMYIFSIVLTQWARNHEQKHECYGVSCIEGAFGSIMLSFLTLLQILCFDNTFALIRPVIDEEPAYGLLLILFILIAAFTVLNMLIGVICQIVSSTNEAEKEKLLQSKVRRVFDEIDRDGSGTLSRAEFIENNAEEKLLNIGLKEDIVRTTFDIIDCNHDELIEMQEFLDTMYKLMHAPESQDILVIHRKLDNLLSFFEKSEKMEPTSRQADMAPSAAQALRRRSIEQGLSELEQQVAAVARRPGFVPVAPTPPVRPNRMAQARGAAGPRDLDLLKLDFVMRQLRQHLEHCTEPRGLGGSAGAEGPNDLWHWRQLCGEVADSITAVLGLIAHVVGEHPPGNDPNSARVVGDQPPSNDQYSSRNLAAPYPPNGRM